MIFYNFLAVIKALYNIHNILSKAVNSNFITKNKFFTFKSTTEISFTEKF